MKLESFKDKKMTRRKMILISLGVITMVGVSLLLYKTFASFSREVSFPLMSGKVNYYGNADIIFAFYNGDQELDEMPQKDNKDNLVFERSVCDNGASIEWNEEKWGPVVLNLTKTKTRCTLYFAKAQPRPKVQLALSVCEKDITASITGEANGEKSITKYEYKIDSNEWQDGSEVNEITNQSEGKHIIKARVTDNEGIVSEEVEQEIEIIDREPEMVEIAGMQVPIATCKNGLYKVEHNNLSELGSEWNKTEYRYAGVNYTNAGTPYVHNYVEFNNEKWRIIGLVNVKTATGVEQRVKIIRTNGISGQTDFGNYAWDRDSSSSYTNNWTTSKLKDMLNGIYYESSNGECYTGSNGSSSSSNTCDFSGNGDLPKGLDDTARQMIDSEVIWNIGGWSTSGITADTMYEKERGDNTYSDYPAEWTTANDETYHKGIGLMYPSDYGYAVGGEVRKICLSNNLNGYNKNNCYTNDWLKESSGWQWLLSPISSRSDLAFYVFSGGYVSYINRVGLACGVAPVGYLLSNVTIYDGDGTFDNPFKLRVG